MTSLEPFIKVLSDTIVSEKLSSSRVERIRTEASRQFHQSPQLVAAFLREHRAARGKTSLSSLYLFDASCRCAQDIIRKRASGFDYKNAEVPRGSSLKRGTKEALVEGANQFLEAGEKAVEEMVLATAAQVRDDQKDKVVKVVDIWLKAGTFDYETLRRARHKICEGQHSASNGERRTKADVRGHSSGEGEDGTATASPYGMLMDDDEIQAKETGPNEGTPTPPNVPSNILAMLGGRSDKDKTAVIEAATTNQPGRKAPEAVQALDPDQLAALQRFAASQQRPSEGGIQDAGTRHQLAALDAADGRHHHAPGEGQDMKTHPPSHQRQNEQRMPSGPPMHPDRARQLHGPPTEAPRPPGPAPALPRKPAADTQAAHVDAHGSGSPPVAAPSRTNAVAGQSATNLRHSPTISAAQGGHPSFVPNESVGDLSQFDLTSFDPTAASSWLRFAQQWHNTYQYVPSNQELLYGLMSGMHAQMLMQAQMMSQDGGYGMGETGYGGQDAAAMASWGASAMGGSDSSGAGASFHGTADGNGFGFGAQTHAAGRH